MFLCKIVFKGYAVIIGGMLHLYLPFLVKYLKIKKVKENSIDFFTVRDQKISNCCMYLSACGAEAAS